MRLSRPFLVIASALILVLLFSAWSEATRPLKGPHSRLELSMMKSDLPWVVGEFFATAGRCAGCHGRDLQGFASIDSEGNDINVVDDWRSTMMANSARDPFFRAKLEHEILMAPQHQAEIENTCTRCHAPMGNFEEVMAGHPPFTAAMLDTSSLGLDGVSCLACHMQSPEESGSFFSGDTHFDSAQVYGPYADDQINPAIMTSFVGWTPGFGQHMVDSRVCAGCHTLITGTTDLEGNYTGDRFVEQATYHEWKNSIYSSNGTECNTCHMPRTDDPIILAAEYAFLGGQSPFGKHHFAGSNVHMLRLLKQNKGALGISATDAQFDSTIARTERMLQHLTLSLSIDLIDRDADTARFEILLENLAGHRFPSGYPSRRAFVQLFAFDSQNDTIFKSGRLRGDLEVEGKDPIEPHYDLITDPGQVQIYELVMGDVNGDETTVLHRAKEPIKDNRLVPIGFSTTHISYDTTRIAGDALTDQNFNRYLTGDEGSGSDRIRYHVPLSGYDGALRVHVQVLYQPVPPGWNEEMFSHSGDRIDEFAQMLSTSDASPTPVATDSLFIGPVGITDPLIEAISIYPNPTVNGVVKVIGEDLEILSIHDASGKLLPLMADRNARGWRIQLPEAPGTYSILIRQNDRLLLKRALRL